MDHKKISVAELAGMIDHAELRPEATRTDLLAACQTAADYHVAALCVQPCNVSLAAEQLAGSGVSVASVIAFPHGATTADAKAAEAAWAVAAGANELDMVLNIGRLRDGNLGAVCDDIAAVVAAAAGHPVKVILECCFLTNEQIVAGCHAAVGAGAAFVKTSTGFARSGATAENVALMRRTVGPNIGVKASGGIRTLADALAMVDAGANRLGLSRTPAVLDELGGKSVC